MHLPRLRTRLALTVVAAAAPLAGCGQGAAKATAPAPRGIYTSSGDCAEAGKLTFEQCASAMEHAVAGHEKAAPSYSSLKSCEKTESEERCERTASGGYRPRLLAFLVTAGASPTARPLYAPPEGKEGFRAADKTLFLVSDETLTFSGHAQTLAEGGADAKKKKR
jgi:uncharacterized protein YgiB involved in biofilm formation